ncbi:TPP-requiring enzyme co-localized with fatty acid metabolic genes [Actinomycetales bacterium JB111]|nr:TPP-requiring enzyme co-localized with fatty acid metabolic genes [Actinomycetales bacterium JB111]
MRVSEAVGRLLVERGVRQVFGVVGSGNFFVTQAMVESGASFVASRHEHGAGMMADAYGRLTGEVAAVSLHQGCGLTNAMTAITEAAKSHTPMLVLTGDTPPNNTTNNFYIEQADALRALGAEVAHLHSAATALADADDALHRARTRRQTVVLNMRLDVQEEQIDWPADLVAALPALAVPSPAAPAPDAVDRLADLLGSAQRPLLVAGRGARAARAEILALADATGALVATSAVGRGLFAGEEWSLDVMGGFASPAAAELIGESDLVVAFGASLNRWTARNGSLLAGATVAQVDDRPDAIGWHSAADVGVVGDVALTARALVDRLVDDRLADGPAAVGRGRRTDDVRERIAGVPWRTVSFVDGSGPDGAGEERIDPRAATLALDAILPAERVVVPDAGNMACYPAMFLTVPDARSYVLPLAFQSIGMALGASIGAAIASPGRTVVAGIGDGAFMMSIAELDTAVRLALPLVVLVYNDSAYGAEVHHFAGEVDDLSTVTFPETDIAAIARGFGAEGVTVRAARDLDAVAGWVAGRDAGAPRGPLVVDLKVTPTESWVLAHTFTGEIA